MKKIAILGLYISIISMCTCCDINDKTVCQVKQYADLLIPTILGVYNQYGAPLLNNYGQQVEDYNELYYNTRTQELFTHKYPPQYGVVVGDILQIGTRVLNTWLDNECKKGKDAGETQTAPKLTYSGPLGNGQVPLQSNYTPPVALNSPSGSFTYTSYRLAAPGYYKVDFNANSFKTEQEHSFDNNIYWGNNGGNQMGKKESYSLEVSESNNILNSNLPNQPTVVVLHTPYGDQMDWGTTAENYLKSPLARYLQKPDALYDFYKFKLAHPNEAFLIKE